MTGTLEFTNVNRDEVELTLDFLKKHGIDRVLLSEDPEGSPLFEFSFAVDTLDDVKTILAVMLFYNMKSEADIQKILKVIK